MGALALLCAVILLIIIPNEIWGILLYLGLVLIVGAVGFYALMFWLIS